ncbi:MAG: hypothetical protein COB46_02545 [Rhodospirillaceae bacterium]|nr:MAG: hypothetical protein COB46_02545 [Rhodospirillaceae bacterium]
MLLVAWRLASGPVSIGFLTPYLETALDDAYKGAFDITVEDTILTWAGWERTLDIRVVNVRSKLASGDVIATVPEISISLSAKALLKGVVAPRSIEFFGPSLKVQRAADGHFAMGLTTNNPDTENSNGSDNFVESILVVMLKDTDPHSSLTYLKHISVVAAELTYEDIALGTTWYAPSANAKFVRVEDGLKAELDLNLQIGDTLSQVSIEGKYSLSKQRADLGLSFEDIRPSEFASVSSQLNFLQALDLPLSGTLTLSIEKGGILEGVGFDLVGGDGHITLPVPLAVELGALDWAQRFGVTAIDLKGRYEGVGNVVNITDLNLTTKPGETLYLPAPLDHELAFENLSTSLSYVGATGQLNVDHLRLDYGQGFGDLKTDISATVVKNKNGSMLIDLKGVAQNVRYDDLPALWPKTLGVDVRTWVMESLSAGIADRASIDVSLDFDDKKGLQLKKVSGNVTSHGLTVNYISTMPRVKNAKGHATFNDKEFNITIETGTSDGGLKIKRGTVNLVKLQEDMQWAEINLDIDGPVPAILKLIDSEPLRFASGLGMDAATATGFSSGSLNLRIPLKNDLVASEVEVLVSTKLTKAGLKGVIFDKDITQSTLDVVVDNNGLAVKGTAKLGQVPVQLKWDHDFRPNALFTDRYEVSGYIEDVLNLGALGIHVPDILSRYMSGGAEVNINHTALSDGRQSLSARIDLANVVLSAPELGWEKASGVPGTAVMEMRIDHNVLDEIPKFSVSAPDMDIAGSVSFLKGGVLERVNLDTMRSGLTDVTGSLIPLGGDEWEIVLRGDRFDGRVLWNEFLGKGKAPTPKSEAKDTDEKTELVIHAAVDIRSLLVGQDKIIQDVIGSVYRDRGLWRKMDISGVVGKTGTVEVMLGTGEDQLRYLSITSDDAGATLKTLDLHDNILGGKFDLKAAYTRPGKNAPLEGKVTVEDYAMLEAPTFAKLIGVMSLTGILDALQGEGLNFDILDMPFKLEDGVLELTHARASGPTLGVTATGTVDMSNQVLDLKGTVVPAYAINALLGKIPLIGPLFTGGEEGGGLFAAAYTMKGQGENVVISMNPLSVLAPGVLRNIFTGTDEVKDAKPKPKPVEVK